MKDTISIIGARVHNLKNISVDIPRKSLTVITGLSGSGKSSLAFDTIYAEGQRRYMETISMYARQYIGSMERPDVDKISGLSPVVAIEQKTTNKNPRSTVGTITEINDFLRLLFARVSRAYSPVTSEEMSHYTDEQIYQLILDGYSDKKVALLAPVVKNRKGHYRELFESLSKKGFIYARIDGEIREFSSGERLDRYKNHNIELVVDRLTISENQKERILKSINECMKQGKGTMALHDYSTGEIRYYSRNLMCPTSGMALEDPEPYTFSFNSPKGACPRCNGLGEEACFDLDKIIPNRKLSIREGGIEPLGKYHDNSLFAIIDAICHRHEVSLEDKLEDFGEEALNAVLYGDSTPVTVNNGGIFNGSQLREWQGIAEYIESTSSEESSRGDKWREQFMEYRECSLCHGSRLKEEALYFRIGDKNIADVCAMSIEDFYSWICNIENVLSSKEQQIGREIIKEIRERTSFLIDVGLGYLSLSRASRTLSGGESQRIRLATQIGSKLVNVLYILDEPSIGLHQRDNQKLINSLKSLRDAGNTVIVVEHDEEMMRSSDYIIDVGPKAGRFGGKIMAAGTLQEILKVNSITTDYLKGFKKIEIPKTRRPGNGKFITLQGASGNNLKDVTVSLPLGTFICVSGVSGSGKSTLINKTLVPILSRKFYHSFDRPLSYSSIDGVENIDKIVVVDQSPIGRSPRSNPVTYTNIFADIRKLFEMTPDAKARGFSAGRFSFNVKGGRCECCKGAGVQTIEMNFLPDVYVKCKECDGKRYNSQTLDVRYKGKNINDVLNMTINMAVEFFEAIPNIHDKLKSIQSVGLGYLTLGQPCTTLSGGESQRIKLASELSKKDTGKTLFVLDEPTTGLHFEDIRQLLQILQNLVNKGNTVIVIEHNLDVIKVADYLIDIGPEGGREGGKIVATGTPEDICKNPDSYTGHYLKDIIREK